MPALSKRLKTIASLVPQGARVCDVGTDHGYLAIHLKASGIAQSVIATDIRISPLENARANILKSGVTGIDTRLCDGLNGVSKGEIDTAVIAGMGGEVISGIIAACPWAREIPIFILQPTTSAEALRRFLAENGFEIKSETAVSENGKLYSVMLAAFTGNTAAQPEYTYYTGKLDPSDYDGLLSLKKQQKRFIDCAEAIYGIPEKQKEFAAFKSLAYDIGKVSDSAFSLSQAKNSSELTECLEIRRKVFEEEKQIPASVQRDSLDSSAECCDHFLLRHGNIPAGALRCVIDGNTVKLQRFCLLPEYRGLGLAGFILIRLENHYRKHGISKLFADAKFSARKAYKKNGYTAVSEIFMEAGTEHIRMEKQI